MKPLSKPLSSPSRSDKFPPPLMRFLRSSAASRSRGRSRSSPMFYLRGRRSAPGVVETAQEPSSPKVTCIGQVRVRRSSKAKARRTAAVKRRRCWLRKTLCFGKTSPKFLLLRGKNPFGGVFCKCGSIFRWGYCKKVDSTDSVRVFSNSRGAKTAKLDSRSNGVCSSNGSDRDCTNKRENRGARSLEIERGLVETSSSSSPPKNALMLTRCRSAPYRSSSLGGRFWGSPLAEKDDDDGSTGTAENGGKPEESPAIAIVEEKEEEESSNQMESSAENVEEIKKIGGGAVHPLLLTRCKSEPARTGERLSADAIFARQRRLDDGLVHTRSQQNS